MPRTDAHSSVGFMPRSSSWLSSCTSADSSSSSLVWKNLRNILPLVTSGPPPASPLVDGFGGATAATGSGSESEPVWITTSLRSLRRPSCACRGRDRRGVRETAGQGVRGRAKLLWMTELRCTCCGQDEGHDWLVREHITAHQSWGLERQV
eukprot:365807-Chlamydomonas_euryale.AAC.3